MSPEAGTDCGQDKLTTLLSALSITPSLKLMVLYSLSPHSSWLSCMSFLPFDANLFREMIQGSVVEEHRL